MHSIGQKKKMRCNFNFFFFLLLWSFNFSKESLNSSLTTSLLCPLSDMCTHLSQNFFGESSSRAREEAIFIGLPSSPDTQHTLI